MKLTEAADSMIDTSMSMIRHILVKHETAQLEVMMEMKEEMEKLRNGLENCRLLAARHRKEDWAL